MAQYVCNQDACANKPFVTNRLHKIEGHLSSKHLDYYPYICAICGENGQEICAPSMNGIQLHNQMHHRGQMEKVKICLDEEKQEELLQLIEMCTQPADPGTAATAFVQQVNIKSESLAAMPFLSPEAGRVSIDYSSPNPSVPSPFPAEPTVNASAPFRVETSARGMMNNIDQPTISTPEVRAPSPSDGGLSTGSVSIFDRQAASESAESTAAEQRPKKRGRGRPRKNKLILSGAPMDEQLHRPTKRIRVRKSTVSQNGTKSFSPSTPVSERTQDSSSAIRVEYEESSFNPKSEKKCTLCSQIVRKASSGLSKHVMGHHMSMDCWKCSRCDFHGKWDTSVWKHQVQVHGIRGGARPDPEYNDHIDTAYISCFGVSQRNGFACDSCNFEADAPKGLKIHKQMVHKSAARLNKSIEKSPSKWCVLCRKYVSKVNNSGLRGHVIGHHIEEDCWMCKYCDFHSSWENSVRNHQNKQHDGNTKGVRIDPVFNDRIKTAYESCFGVPIYVVTCDQCGTQVDTPQGLKGHKTRMHSNKQKEQTPKPGRENRRNSRQELNNFDTSPPGSIRDSFKRCLLCDQQGLGKRERYNHVVGKHMDVGCWACPYCAFHGKWKVNVYVHQRESHKGKERQTVRVDEAYVDQIAKQYDCCFGIQSAEGNKDSPKPKSPGLQSNGDFNVSRTSSVSVVGLSKPTSGFPSPDNSVVAPGSLDTTENNSPNENREQDENGILDRAVTPVSTGFDCDGPQPKEGIGAATDDA